MTAAVKLRKINGGIVVVNNDELLDYLPLPIGGLMADMPIEDVKYKLENMIKITRELGCKLTDPFLTLSFLALPVIPKLKLTDKGLVDVDKFKIVSLFV